MHEAAWEVPDDLGEYDKDNAEEEEIFRQEDDHTTDEDDDFDNIGKIDWDKFRGFGKDGCLSAWDELGAGYYQQFASIGRYSNSVQFDWLTAVCLVEKLDTYNLAICRAFSYKVQTHTTDRDFAKLPFAFPSNPPLPKLDSVRSCVAFLAGFEPEMYDCCPNSCVCYTGSHKK